ncbi:MAG: hypothetical protein K6G88_06345 [Lachnospiraceae bacterium]|nr:hypothetical protein [Lachnospiraceae bacterium]
MEKLFKQKFLTKVVAAVEAFAIVATLLIGMGTVETAADEDTYVYFTIESQYAYIGDSLTVKPIATNDNGEEVDVYGDYTYKWYRITNENDFHELDCTTYYFTINNIQKSDLFNYSDVEYEVEIYKDGSLFTNLYFYIYEDGKTDIYIDDDGIKNIRAGQQITLAPKIIDSDNKAVDPAAEGLTVKWTRLNMNNDEMTDLNNSSLTYTFVPKTEDFTNRSQASIYYIFALYRGNQQITSIWYTINDIDYLYYSVSDTYYPNPGERVELNAKIYNYKDDEEEFNSNEFTFEWYKGEENSESLQLVGTDKNLVINSVSKNDVYDYFKDKIMYTCKVYKSGINVASTYYYLVTPDVKFDYEGRHCYYKNVGDSVTFKFEATYGGKALSAALLNQLQFRWYKYTDYSPQEEILSVTDTLEVPQITEEDFNNNAYYRCEFSSGDGNWNCIDYYFDDLQSEYNESWYSEDVFTTKGSKLELKPVVYSNKHWSAKVDVTGANLTYVWKKAGYVDGEYQEIEVASGKGGYTIASVSDSDLSTVEDQGAKYILYTYNHDILISVVNYYIYDKESYLRDFAKCWFTAYSGDTVTFCPDVRDWEDNPVDITGDGYTYKWFRHYKGEEDKIPMQSSSVNCTIKVEARDYYIDDENWENDSWFVFEVYKDGEKRLESYYYIELPKDGSSDNGGNNSGNNSGSNSNSANNNSQKNNTSTGNQTGNNANNTSTTGAKNVTNSNATTAVKVKATAIKSASMKKGSKKAKITLKKVKGVTGYQVSVSTSKKFTKKTTITKSTKKTSITIKKLKADRTYFVKARCYKTVNKKANYSKWSKVKKIKIKK